eukprot:3817924-Amphidinium_carterae.1
MSIGKAGSWISSLESLGPLPGLSSFVVAFKPMYSSSTAISLWVGSSCGNSDERSSFFLPQSANGVLEANECTPTSTIKTQVQSKRDKDKTIAENGNPQTPRKTIKHEDFDNKEAKF